MINPAIAIIQARLSSSRLPGKVMKLLAGHPMIWHIYKRAEQCRFVDKVIIATSNDESDDPLAEFCYRNKMNVFRGSLTNVMGRYIQILKQNKYKYYVRITGDCPLIHPDFIDHQIIALKKFNGDSVWIPKPGSLFEGQGVHSSRSLFHIASNSNSQIDLEHVGAEYHANNPEKFRIVEFELSKNLIIEDIRLTIDEEEDFTLMNEIYQALWKNRPIHLKEVLAFLENNPEINKINQKIKHNRLNIDIREKINKWEKMNKVGLYKYTEV